MMTTLSSLPQDVLLAVFRDLDFTDVIRVGIMSPQAVALSYPELLYRCAETSIKPHKTVTSG